jgi:hypothetical protein
MGPKIVAEALWRAEGFTDVQYQGPFQNLEARLGPGLECHDIERRLSGLSYQGSTPAIHRDLGLHARLLRCGERVGRSAT